VYTFKNMSLARHISAAGVRVDVSIATKSDWITSGQL